MKNLSTQEGESSKTAGEGERQERGEIGRETWLGKYEKRSYGGRSYGG